MVVVNGGARKSDSDIPENLSLPGLLLARCDIDPDRTAIIDGDNGYSLTYGDYKHGVCTVAHALMEHGLQKGDVMALCSPNGVHQGVMLIAIQAAGGVPSTMNPAFTIDETSRQIQDSGARFLVVPAEDIQKVCQIQARCPTIKAVFTIGRAEGYVSVCDLMKRTGYSSLPEVSIVPRKDLACLPYSSGTTGFPKGVMLTHYALVASILSLLKQPSSCRRGDVLVAIFPLFHIAGFVESFIAPFCAISTVVFFKKFDFETFLAANQKYQATVLAPPPSVTMRLAKDHLVDSFDISSVKRLWTGGAPVSAQIQKEVIDRLKLEFFQIKYGLTETGGATNSTSHPESGEFVLGSPGKCRPGVKQKIVSVETGEILGPGRQGEVCVLSPGNMIGYLNRPEATAATLDSYGWLHTGDVGYMDGQGNLYLVDRVKELIKYKGFQVPPAELEALLLTHPDVADSAVVGVPDEKVGELPKAFVVLKPGKKWDPENIRCFVKRKAAPYKQLRGGVELLDTIPRTPSGKILRRVLRDKYMAKSKL